MSRTGSTSTGRLAGLSAGRLLVMLTALAGLFAMHGLSEHGVMHHDMSSSASMTADAMDMISAVALEDAAEAATTTATSAAGALTTGVLAAGAGAAGAGDQDADMAMALCLAILAGLVVLLLRAQGRAAGLLPRRVARDTHAPIARTSRDPDPPDLFALSIQRC